jgi:hypothetical protein
MDIIGPRRFGTSKLGVRHKQTGSLVPPKFKGNFSKKKPLFSLSIQNYFVFLQRCCKRDGKPGNPARGLPATVPKEEF